MWVMTNFGVFSIVANRKKKDSYLVRARNRKHLEDLLKMVEGNYGLDKCYDIGILENAAADYQFRIYVDRVFVDIMMEELVDQIQYDNFKNSVKDFTLHELYNSIWREVWLFLATNKGTTY